MLRRAVCLLFLLPVLAVADLRSELQARYNAFDKALARGDVRAVETWVQTNSTLQYTYTSRDRNIYDLKRFLKGLRDQIGMTKKVVDSGIKIVDFKQKGNTATVTAESHTTARVVFDGQNMRLVDKSKTTDIWIKIGTQWKVKKSVQVTGDTQMFQE